MVPIEDDDVGHRRENILRKIVVADQRPRVLLADDHTDVKSYRGNGGSSF